MTITRANIEQMENLVAELRRENITVLYQANWMTRDAGGSFGPWVAGIVHHDASTLLSGTWGSLPVIVSGREGIPGPLAQLQVARFNRPQVAVVTAGRANHAGKGGPYGTIPRDSGNRWMIGWEVANDGVGETYSTATLETVEAIGYYVDRLAA